MRFISFQAEGISRFGVAAPSGRVALSARGSGYPRLRAALAAGAGISFDPPRCLKPGDTVRVEVSEVGSLENPVSE